MFASQLGAEEASTAVVPASQASISPVPLYTTTGISITSFILGGIAAYFLYQYSYGEE